MDRPPSPPSPSGVVVLGRFPPPADGQALATALCADLLEQAERVERLNTQPPGGGPLHATPRFSARRMLHFLRLRRHLKQALAIPARRPVVWHSVSPALLGHLRDIVATVPAFGPEQPVAAVLHRAGFEKLGEHPLTGRSVKKLVDRVEQFVFLTEELSDRCSGLIPGEKRRVIPNAVAPELVSTREEVEAKQRAASQRFGGETGAMKLLFLSNMMPEKGFSDVLSAAALLVGRGVDVDVTFAGRWPDPSDTAIFERQVHSAGLQHCVRHLGPVHDRCEVRRLHLDADVFLLPSYHPTEAQPVAPLEALAAGTPLVVTDRPAFREILGASNAAGALVPPRSPRAIAAAVERLRSGDAWARASSSARARYESGFSHEIVASMWRELVADLTARTG